MDLLVALETRPLLTHDPFGVRYSARIRRQLIRFDGQDHGPALDVRGHDSVHRGVMVTGVQSRVHHRPGG